jgi:hypothetical protein
MVPDKGKVAISIVILLQGFKTARVQADRFRII